ncbi:MAG TPA: acyl-homoserine-lactone synthase [Beijerinckiaceae bacterium]|jgi:acyl-homoserine lactone synthase
MTAIHVVTCDNRHAYRTEIERHHALRHDVFVGERGWTALERPDGRDVDAYDDHNAVYLLAIDGERVVGGQRLYPTVLPHMMSEVFPYLASRRGVPRAPDVFEWTRYFVVKERRVGRTDCMLLAGLQQFCLEEGIAEVTAVVETWWLPRWQQAGFRARPLGLPAMVEGQPTLAVAVEISQESLAAVRAKARLPESVLVRRGRIAPVVDRVSYARAS